MSIGTVPSEGMTVRSPSSKSPQQREMEDVELGPSRGRLLKAKESDVTELQEKESAEGSSSTMKSLVASTLYSGCSVGMVLVNKSLASRYVRARSRSGLFGHSCRPLNDPASSFLTAQLQPPHRRRPEHPPGSLPSRRRSPVRRILQIHGVGGLPPLLSPNGAPLVSRQPALLRHALHGHGLAGTQLGAHGDCL